MAKIIQISAREILDSRGQPTVSAEVILDDGSRASAGVPSGASTGAFEAIELRDGDKKRYGGLGVLKAVQNVETEIFEAVRGLEAADQEMLDRKMISLDGTENKGRLGANAILAVSLATCRAAAVSQNIPLYEHIADIGRMPDTMSEVFPVPMFNVLNGGKHADSGLSVQEFKLIPSGILEYPEQLRAGSEIFQALKKLLKEHQQVTGVGDEGGFAPHLESHAAAFEILQSAITAAGYTPGQDIFLGIDAASNSFYEATDSMYHLEPEGVVLTAENLVNLYRDWKVKYHLVSVEDGLNEEDWDGWVEMHERLRANDQKTLLIGDDLLVTNVRRLEKAIEMRACNAVLIKVNQIGTLTETLDCVRLAKENGFKTIVSHRSGETIDDFIADLAVGVRADYIKTGSLSRGERLAKYNRLLEIWDDRSKN